jgi:hypothetical protein
MTCRTLNRRSARAATMTAVAAMLALAGMPAAAAAPAAVDHFASPWPLTDTFEGEPRADHAVPGTSCVTAERYVTMVATHRWTEIGSVFAQDAVFLPPDGPALHGRAAIAAWFAKAPPVAIARPLAFTAAGRQCFMEIAGKRVGQADAKWRISAIDHFTMNERNEIVRAIYYFRPQTLLGRPMDTIPPATGK